MKYKHKTTGDIVKPYSKLYYICSDTTCIPKRFIEDSCDWEKVEELNYEIINYRDYNGYVYSYCNNGFAINAVKRLSDNAIFTLRGKFTCGGGFGGMITEFTVFGDELLVNAGISLDELDAPKEVLFTTEDGVELYGGESVHWVHCDDIEYQDFSKEDSFFTNVRDVRGYKIFAEKENAEEYILFNKPCLSFNDLVELSSRVPHSLLLASNRLGTKDWTEVLKLVKSKL